MMYLEKQWVSRKRVKFSGLSTIMLYVTAACFVDAADGRARFRKEDGMSCYASPCPMCCMLGYETVVEEAGGLSFHVPSKLIVILGNSSTNIGRHGFWSVCPACASKQPRIFPGAEVFEIRYG